MNTTSCSCTEARETSNLVQGASAVIAIASPTFLKSRAGEKVPLATALIADVPPCHEGGEEGRLRYRRPKCRCTLCLAACRGTFSHPLLANLAYFRSCSSHHPSSATRCPWTLLTIRARPAWRRCWRCYRRCRWACRRSRRRAPRSVWMLLLAHADMSTTAVARTLPADAAECMHGLADVGALALRGVSGLSVLRVAPTLSLLTDSHPRCRCSRTVDGARRAVQAGAIAAVIDALARHCDRPDVAVMACTAVSHLAAESSASSFASPITKLGLIHSLTHLLLTVASPSHGLPFLRPHLSMQPTSVRA